ncbi:MAG: hypothetical protein JWQ74_3753 [Marmoricola sp.]|nr:hypothetical protein [Marmoricola sp.]
MTGPSSYLVCATPRTGSTLLCSFLASTGVAGRPESYFREPDRRLWAERFGVPVDDDGSHDFAAFVAGAVRSGTSANGVFAARIMWGTLPSLLAGLAEATEGRPDVETLEGAFGPLRFVHLQRRDVVAQAVSWARAEQSAYWHPGDVAQGEPRFDIDQIDRLVATIGAHNAAWSSWFDREGVVPLRIDYEQVTGEPREAVGSVLRWIGSSMPASWVPESRQRRQADLLNADWTTRYLAARA